MSLKTNKIEEKGCYGEKHKGPEKKRITSEAILNVLKCYGWVGNEDQRLDLDTGCVTGQKRLN